MPLHRTLTIMGLAALCLCACNKNPVPTVEPSSASTERIAVPPSDASVPSAASVLAPTPQASVAADGRALGTLSGADQFTAMPLPGQANDHSAPLPPASGASGR